MKLSAKDKKLVKASIKHWEKDIGEPILDQVGDCALCGEYYDDSCEGCPYFLFYGMHCTWKHYDG